MKKTELAPLLLSASVTLVSCSGGGGGATRALPATNPAAATLTVAIPNGGQVPAALRKTRTIGSGSASIVVRYVGGNNPSFAPSTPFDFPSNAVVASGTPVNLTTGSGGNCTSSGGNLTCTLSGIVLPVGSLDLYILDYDGQNGTGNLIYGSVTPVQFNANGTFTVESTTNEPVTLNPLQLNPAYYSPPPPSAAQLVYVSDRSQNAILGYPLGEGGNISPAKIITGSQTQLSSPQYMTFDAAGNLYIADELSPGGSILVFAKGSSGNVAPARIIAGANTTFSNTNSIGAIAVDAQGYLYVAEDNGSSTCTTTCVVNSDGTIAVFAPGASGNVAPVNTISSTACFAPAGLAVDSSGELIVACDGRPSNPGAPPGGTIVTFPAGASGNATPVRTISGAVRSFGTLTLSPNGTILVLAYTIRNDVYGYPETGDGNVQPTMMLGGAIEQNGGVDITVDSSGMFYVLSAGLIMEFASTANGSSPPIYTISGSNTGMSGSNFGIAVGPP